MSSKPKRRRQGGSTDLPKSRTQTTTGKHQRKGGLIVEQAPEPESKSVGLTKDQKYYHECVFIAQSLPLSYSLPDRAFLIV